MVLGDILLIKTVDKKTNQRDSLTFFKNEVPSRFPHSFCLLLSFNSHPPILSFLLQHPTHLSPSSSFFHSTTPRLSQDPYLYWAFSTVDLHTLQ